ncbi:MAG TPA: ester cyclase [Chloroflexota bacterium]|nr:ester cyclase [Chloroflexota bacterium]
MTAGDEVTRNEETVRRFIEEVGNNHNPDVIEEVIAPTSVEHPMSYSSHLLPGEESMSPGEAMRIHLAFMERNYTNLHTAIDRLFGAGDMVTVVGTDTGMRGGKPITVKWISVARLEDGKIVESWDLLDRLGLYQQLGVVPETPVLAEQAGLK